MTSAATTFPTSTDVCHAGSHGLQMSGDNSSVASPTTNNALPQAAVPAAAVAVPSTLASVCDGTSSQGSKAVSGHTSPDGGVNKRTPSATELRELLSSLGALVQMDTVNEIGPEKRLELDLRPRAGTTAESLTQVPGAVDKMLGRMKMLDDAKLDRQVHPVAGDEALSVSATDAMVLFARRRFVVTASHKFPLHRYIADLLKAIRAAGFDVEWASFMRKNDVSPWAAKDLQMAKEFSVLKLFFPKGRSHMFGAVDGDHYYFFVADNIDRALPQGTRTVEDDVQFNMKLYDVEYQGDEQCFQRLGISEKAMSARKTLQQPSAFATSPNDVPSSHVSTPRDDSGNVVGPAKGATSPESLLPPATPMSANEGPAAGSRRTLPRTPSQGSVAGTGQQYEVAVQGCRFYSNEWYEHLRIAHRVDGGAHSAVATYETTVDEHETARDAMVDLVKSLRPGRFTIIALVDPCSRTAALLRRRQDIGVEPRLYEGYALQTRTLNTFQAGYQVVKSTFVRCDLDTRVHPPLPAA